MIGGREAIRYQYRPCKNLSFVKGEGGGGNEDRGMNNPILRSFLFTKRRAIRVRYPSLFFLSQGHQYTLSLFHSYSLIHSNRSDYGNGRERERVENSYSYAIT